MAFNLKINKMKVLDGEIIEMEEPLSDHKPVWALLELQYWNVINADRLWKTNLKFKFIVQLSIIKSEKTYELRKKFHLQNLLINCFYIPVIFSNKSCNWDFGFA